LPAQLAAFADPLHHHGSPDLQIRTHWSIPTVEPA
jgi:hypothetical protein